MHRNRHVEKGAPMAEAADVREDADRAERLGHELVDTLLTTRVITSPRVEAAFRTVPRHAFVPADTPLHDVYAVDRSVITKRDEHGVAQSSVSATYIQARMIEQAGVQPGMRVLEIGSGGYNAALLAEVVGAEGHVVSVDIDPQITDRAKTLLEENGYDHQVRVLCTDAEHGVPGEGVFDRILVTVGSWDIPPALLDQLAADGVLVVPLRMNGVTRSIAFRRSGDRLVSGSSEVAGFVPIQGDGARPERILTLPDRQDRHVNLRFDSATPDAPTLLDDVLDTARSEEWSGVTIENGVSFADLHLWFAGFLPGFCLLTADEGTDLANERGTWFPFGVVRGDSFAYLAVRPLPDGAGAELGARAYGPHGDEPAAAMVTQIQAWDRQARSGPAPTFAYWPTGTDPGDQPGNVAVLPKTHGLLTISWPVPTARDTEAERLRNALVDSIRGDGYATTAAVETALRSVARHLFVPDAPLAAAYSDSTVNIKYDTDGTTISCASQPGVVALMLDQLQAQPGDRILELGAGTGYNAALLAHLVGEHGHVTTIDVDHDLADAARAHLAAAGATNVEVITGEGALGHAEGAPYDRIIATVGAHGVPHAWLTQLAPGGRLVVPQRLTGSVSRSIAYEHHDGRWISRSSMMNTFMPLRRGIADDERRIIPISADSTVRLQVPAGQRIDPDAFAGVLDQPRTQQWTGVTFQARESPEWMELFVSCTMPSGLVRMLFPPSAKGMLLAEDPYPSSAVAIGDGTIAYLARRLSTHTTPEGGKLWEFGVVGHGPGSHTVATQVTRALCTWNQEYRGREATFEIQPLDAPPTRDDPGLFSLDTPLNRIVVDWR